MQFATPPGGSEKSRRALAKSQGVSGAAKRGFAGKCLKPKEAKSLGNWELNIRGSTANGDFYTLMFIKPLSDRWTNLVLALAAKAAHGRHVAKSGASRKGAISVRATKSNKERQLIVP